MGSLRKRCLDYSESIIKLSELIDNRRVRPYAASHDSTTRIAGGPDRKTQAGHRPPGGFAPGQTVAAIQCLRQGGLPLQDRSSAKAWPVLPGELYPQRQELDPICAERRLGGGAAAVAQLPALAEIARPLDHVGDGTVASATSAVVRTISRHFPKATAHPTRREASLEGLHFMTSKTPRSLHTKGFRVSRQKLARLVPFWYASKYLRRTPGPRSSRLYSGRSSSRLAIFINPSFAPCRPSGANNSYSTLAFRVRNYEQLVEARHAVRQKTILTFGMIGIGEGNYQRITEHG